MGLMVAPEHGHRKRKKGMPDETARVRIMICVTKNGAKAL
jgi:hypothetical protein